MTQQRLLIVEDDPGLQSQLRWSFTDVATEIAGDADTALTLIKSFKPQIVTLDLGLPPDAGGCTVGFQLLKQILTLAPYTKVIIITGQEDRDHAIQAIDMGAYDFFNKPVEKESLVLVVKRAFQLYELEVQNRKLKQRLSDSPIDGIITSSPHMTKICSTIEKVAKTDLSVLILGESGTGKELFARALHNLSFGDDGPLIAINCSAIPENLLESELFGHEKGAFTGAHKQKKGKVELAEGGTLFLDEIGDMPLMLQAKMLRFLQERVIERVGGTSSISINTRVICATHRNIHTMIDDGDFRSDLYFRISDIVLDIPPLRERHDDALLLATYFLHKNNQQQLKGLVGFTTEAERRIRGFAWPGNVRELEKCIRRAVIMSDGPYIDVPDLALDDAMLSTNNAHSTTPTDDTDNSVVIDLKTVRATVASRPL